MLRGLIRRFAQFVLADELRSLRGQIRGLERSQDTVNRRIDANNELAESALAMMRTKREHDEFMQTRLRNLDGHVQNFDARLSMIEKFTPEPDDDGKPKGEGEAHDRDDELELTIQHLIERGDPLGVYPLPDEDLD